MPKAKSPSRVRYESAHPTLTARVPAEVKAQLEAALAAERTSFSEWVRRQAAGSTEARRDDAALRAAGYAAGLADGRAQARAAYLIISAAMLWQQYGARLGDTNDAWIDRRAVECAQNMPPGVRAYLLDRLRQAPTLRVAVDRWLRESDLPGLPT